MKKVNKSKHPNTYQIMRQSNLVATEWLKQNGYTMISKFGHHRRGMSLMSIGEPTRFTKDLWNVGDGICLNTGDKEPYLIQIKTGSWANDKELIEFTKQWIIDILVLNVIGKAVMVRHYFEGVRKDITPDIRKYKWLR